jgi:hypothetical protein
MARRVNASADAQPPLYPLALSQFPRPALSTPHVITGTAESVSRMTGVDRDARAHTTHAHARPVSAGQRSDGGEVRPNGCLWCHGDSCSPISPAGTYVLPDAEPG